MKCHKEGFLLGPNTCHNGGESKKWNNDALHVFFPRYRELMLCGRSLWDLGSSPIFFFPHSWRQLGLIWQPIARTHAPAKKREKNCIKIYRYLWYFNSYQVFIIASNCFITHLKQFSFAKIKWIILIYIADLKILVGQVLFDKTWVYS